MSILRLEISGSRVVCVCVCVCVRLCVLCCECAVHTRICGCIVYVFVCHTVYELNGSCTYGRHVVHVCSALRVPVSVVCVV